MFVDLQVLGDDDWLLAYSEPIDVVVSVGDGKLRKEIVERLRQNPNISFPTIIAPSAEVSPYVELGEGSIKHLRLAIRNKVKAFGPIIHNGLHEKIERESELV